MTRGQEACTQGRATWCSDPELPAQAEDFPLRLGFAPIINDGFAPIINDVALRYKYAAQRAFIQVHEIRICNKPPP